MTMKTRLAKLERQIPVSATEGFHPDFEFRVAGMRRSDVQRETVRRLRAAIADPRATEEQRLEWRESAERIQAAISSDD